MLAKHIVIDFVLLDGSKEREFTTVAIEFNNGLICLDCDSGADIFLASRDDLDTFYPNHRVKEVRDSEPAEVDVQMLAESMAEALEDYCCVDLMPKFLQILDGAQNTFFEDCLVRMLVKLHGDNQDDS